MLLLWFVLILFVKERWLAMYNRNLHDRVHVSIPALWAFLQLGNASTIELNMYWKSEKVIKLSKKRKKIERSLNETVNTVQNKIYEFLTRNVFYGLLLGVSVIEVSSRE